jgi:N-acetylneuraminic acid mutarotase
MVEHRGQLYRIGGFTATNKRGDTENLISQADFAKFDPKTAQRTDLPKLPEPRSSHDAALIGNTVYVVGGWNMQGGGSSAQWHATAWACDLSAERPEWKPIAGPSFRRRALALVQQNGKLLCLGGMNEKGGPTTSVEIYDPSSNTWSSGPALIGGGMEGFGSSAFFVGEDVYATTMSGAIQRLRKDATSWELLGQLQHPRFFHRVLPWQGNKLVVVGGSSMESGKVLPLELLVIDGVATAQR